MNPRWTAIVAASVLPALGLLDFAFSRIGGNAATFSAVLLRSQAKFYYLAPGIAYAFGIFMGHVFMPSANPRVPSAHEVLAKLLFAIGPVLGSILLIASGDGETPTPNMMAQQQQILMGGLILLSVAIGMAAGRILVPQHPLGWGVGG